MPKIIVDTNIFVSALIQHSYPFLIIDYLITGNTKHFSMSKYKKTRIVSAKEFWEMEII